MPRRVVTAVTGLPRTRCSRFQGVQRGLRVPIDDVQEDEGGAGRFASAVLPVAQRRDREAEAPGELRLGHAEAVPDVGNVDRGGNELPECGVLPDLFERFCQSCSATLLRLSVHELQGGPLYSCANRTM